MDETTHLVTFTSSDGTESVGRLDRWSRHAASFIVQAMGISLRVSEVLVDFRITLEGRTAYSGRATVSGLVQVSTGLACEVTLEDSWLDLHIPAVGQEDTLKEAFLQFQNTWQKQFRISPEFKLIVADLQIYMTDLRLWLEQLELAIRSSPSGDRIGLEEKILNQIGNVTISALNTLFDSYESLAAGVADADWPAHCNYAKRQLHSLILCAPFVYRTFFKPFGYAGDYEMVDMIARNQFEGGSMFAKVINHWFLQQAPAQAHRNRLSFMTQRLVEETARVSASKPTTRILNLGCGPAVEIQRFLEDSEITNKCEFVLLDFNEETLRHAQSRLEAIQSAHHRTAQIRFDKRSVHQVLKESGKKLTQSADRQYDMVYCAGLFDYLTDQVCHRLIGVFYNWVVPGGLVLVTNVDQSNPRRRTMESLLDWNLIYRNSRDAEKLIPEDIPREAVTVRSEDTGVNIFIEIRKPRHG